MSADAKDCQPLINLALIDCFLDRKEEAIEEAKKASELQGLGIFEKNDALAALAFIYARAGQTDLALPLIEILLTVPANFVPQSIYSLTLADLRCRWAWDPLRSDPRFQKILAAPEPKTIY